MNAMIGSLSALEWALLASNTLLLVFARPILSRILSTTDTRSSEWRLNAFRGLNVLMLLTVGTGAALGPSAGERGWLLKLLLVLATAWCFYLAMQLAGYGLRQRYGVRRTVDGQEVLSDSWTSRLLYLLVCGFLSVLCLVTAIQIAGFNSLLQTTGVLGFLGVFLALTQSSWLPDIAAGLILLDGRMLEEGDVIRVRFADERTTCAVHKTKLFHTRDNLHFKIGYDVPAAVVREIMESAVARAIEVGVPIEGQYPVEVVLQDTGDHALHWMVCYYTKAVRKRLLTRQQLREFIRRVARNALRRRVRPDRDPYCVGERAVTQVQVALIPGDGIGVDVTRATQAVIAAVQTRVSGFSIDYREIEAGAGLFAREGIDIEAGGEVAAGEADAIFLGAIGLPSVRHADGTEISPHLRLRDRFGLYAGVRPVKAYPNAPQRLADPRSAQIDLVILRESTEGLFYSAAVHGRSEVIGDEEVRDTLRISRFQASNAATTTLMPRRST